MQQEGSSAKRADAVTNRARILDAAQAVFVEHGLDLEMGEIALRTHLGVGTLYRHFANREDLLRAIVLRTTDGALAQLRAALPPVEDDPRAALQALVYAGLQVYQHYQHLFAAMRDPRLEKLFESEQEYHLRTQFLAIPEEIIERGIQAGIFRRDLDREIVAATMLGSFSGVLDLMGMHCELDELAQRLLHLFLTMLTDEKSA